MTFLTEMNVTHPKFFFCPCLPVFSVIPDSKHWFVQCWDNVSLSVRCYIITLAQRHYVRWSNVGVASVDTVTLDQRQYSNLESMFRS